MKRDMALIREILLQIERNDKGDGEGLRISISDIDECVLTDHVLQLQEAGFIDAIDVSSSMGRAYMPLRITWAGHDFLDTIRDENIWKKTLASLKKVSGSASLDIVKALAISFTQQQLGLAS